MVNYASIARHIDKGRGIAAKHLAQPFAAYRIEGSSSGDFPGGWSLITANFPLFRRRYIAVGKIETGLARGALWYEIIANMAPYVLGDVFLQIDPDYVPGVSYGAGATLLYGTEQIEALSLAIHMPVGKSIGGRLDRRIKIYRPNAGPATLNDGSSFFKTTLDNDMPLVLTDGTYAFGPPSAAASYIPGGFAAYDRQYGDELFGPAVPSMPKPSRYFVYVPPLPGYTPTEGDAVVAEDGSRYVCELAFYQESGVVGSQLVVHRQIRQNG